MPHAPFRTSLHSHAEYDQHRVQVHCAWPVDRRPAEVVKMPNKHKMRGMGGRSQVTRRSRCTGLLLAALIWGVARAAFGWIYPEHRDIAVLAVQGLDAERQGEFDRLWQEARAGAEQRLCAVGADVEQGLAPPCIDWAALSGIAGDHSCSSQDMFETVRTADWILVVADVAARLKADLARIPVTAPAEQAEATSSAGTAARRRLADQASRAQRVNALHTADLRLQRADPQYATRADANL